MFKSTHIPSKVTKTWRDFIHDKNSILKSANLMYVDDDGVPHYMDGWPPEHLLSEDENTPDHPPLSHNPLTGELMEGFHPIDRIAHDLLTQAQAARGAEVTPEYIKKVMNAIINHHNLNHPEDSKHQGNDFDHVSWRKSNVGDYPEDGITDALTHQIRGHPDERGLGKMQNYSYKQGIAQAEGADPGQHIDSGFWGLYDSTFQVLNEVNKREAAKGNAPLFPNLAIEKENDPNFPYYARGVKVPLSKLTNGRVVPVTANERRGITSGTVPRSLRNRMHTAPHTDDHVKQGDLHLSQLYDMLPDWMFLHNNRGTKKGKLTPAQKMLNGLAEDGIEHNYHPEKDASRLAEMWKTPIIQGMVRGGRSGGAGSANKSAFNQMVKDFGIENHMSTSAGHFRGTGKSDQGQGVRAANFTRAWNALAHKLIDEQGISQEEASAQAKDMIRNHQVHSKGEVNPKAREEMRHIAQGYMDRDGTQPFDLEEVHTEGVPSLAGNEPVISQIPAHMRNNILSPSNKAPPVNAPPTEAPTPEKTVQEAQAPVARAPPKPPTDVPTTGRLMPIIGTPQYASQQRVNVQPSPAPAPEVTARPPPTRPASMPAAPSLPPIEYDPVTGEMRWAGGGPTQWKSEVQEIADRLLKAPVEQTWDVSGKPIYVVGGPGGHRRPLTGRAKVMGAAGRALGAFGGLAGNSRSLAQAAGNVYFGAQQGGRVGEEVGMSLSGRGAKAQAAEQENVHLQYARAQAQGLIPMDQGGSVGDKQMTLTQLNQQQQAQAAKVREEERAVKLREAREMGKARGSGEQETERVARQAAVKPAPAPAATPSLGDGNNDDILDLAQGANPMPAFSVESAAQKLAGSDGIEDIPEGQRDDKRGEIIEVPTFGGKEKEREVDDSTALAIDNRMKEIFNNMNFNGGPPQ
jgi:polyhydroxyalkanoate synthesis regulator phasin